MNMPVPVPEGPPSVVIIAGPNGAGKSSTAPQLLSDSLRQVPFVNADAIARGLSAFDSEAVAYQAGKIMLERIRSLASRRESFGFETTLASRSYAHQIDEWRNAGYLIHLLYLWVASPDMACERVRSRVLAGGHSIDEETIRTRWARSAHNLLHLYVPRCTHWIAYDNSQSGPPRAIAHGRESQPPVVRDAERWNTIAHAASQVE